MFHIPWSRSVPVPEFDLLKYRSIPARTRTSWVIVSSTLSSVIICNWIAVAVVGDIAWAIFGPGIGAHVAGLAVFQR
jgi:hypothetical protein